MFSIIDIGVLTVRRQANGWDRSSLTLSECFLINFMLGGVSLIVQTAFRDGSSFDPFSLG